MKACLYSPFPVDDYAILDLPTDSARTTKMLERGEAIWNLLWLSKPDIDTLRGAGPNWAKNYTPQPALSGAVVRDVNEYDALYEMLHEHPAKFAAWFAKEDHKTWHCYAACGARWVSTVLARAEGASVRLASNVKFEGNVVSVKFGGR
jgi:hypothetical protein